MRRQIIFVFCISVLISLAFQNCSSITNYKILQLESESSGSGNGAGYGGKLGADYAQYIPSFNCEGHESPLMEINFGTVNTTLVEHNEFKCNANSNPLSSEVLDISFLQNEVLGYGANIFVRNVNPSGSIPDQLVEMWCRNYEMPNTFEFIGSYNQKTQSTFSDEYIAQLNLPVQRQQQTGISRKIEELRIYYESDTYSLIVDKSKLSSRAGHYYGTYFDKVKNVSTILECRTGGYLDARIWPAQRMFSIPINSYKISPDSNKVYTELSFQKLFVSSFELNAVKSSLFAPFPIFDLWFVPNSEELLLKAAPNNNMLRQLYSINSDGSNFKSLSTDITDSLQSLREEVAVSDDGKFAYYKDGSQESGADEGWLRRVSLTTGSITEFGFQKLGADLGVYDYVFVKAKNKICYLAGGIYSDLYCTDLDGSNTHKVQFSFTQAVVDYSLFAYSSEFIVWYADLQLTDDGQYLKVDSCAYNHSVITTYLVDVDTYQIRRLPEAGPYLNTNIQTVKNYWIKQKNSILAVRDLNTLVEVDSQIPATAVVSTTGNAIAMLPNNDLQYYSVLDLSINKKLCNIGSAQTAVSLTWLDPVKFLLVSKSKADSRVFFYTGSADTGCTLANSAIQNIVTVSEIKIAKNQKSVVLLVTDEPGGGGIKNLLWVPLDGRPSVQITIPINKEVVIYSFDYAHDDQYIVFAADTFKQFQRSLFSFKLPD